MSAFAFSLVSFFLLISRVEMDVGIKQQEHDADHSPLSSPKHRLRDDAPSLEQTPPTFSITDATQIAEFIYKSLRTQQIPALLQQQTKKQRRRVLYARVQSLLNGVQQRVGTTDERWALFHAYVYYAPAQATRARALALASRREKQPQAGTLVTKKRVGGGGFSMKTMLGQAARRRKTVPETNVFTLLARVCVFGELLVKHLLEAYADKHAAFAMSLMRTLDVPRYGRLRRALGKTAKEAMAAFASDAAWLRNSLSAWNGLIPQLARALGGGNGRAKLATKSSSHKAALRALLSRIRDEAWPLTKVKYAGDNEHKSGMFLTTNAHEKRDPKNDEDVGEVDLNFVKNVLRQKLQPIHEDVAF